MAKPVATEHGGSMKERPVIGIPADCDENNTFTLAADYCRVIADCGGLPVLVPPLATAELIPRWLTLMDGLLLAGGGDIDPYHYGEDPLPRLGRITPERDVLELNLARGALQAGMPLLGICRGLQILCVAAGGTLLQDIRSQVPGAIKHRQRAPTWYASHEVILEPETQLARLVGSESVRVNSFHHQAVDVVPLGFTPAATAPDGVIEAIESREGSYALGVQWHPEVMLAAEPRFKDLFTSFVAAAAANKG